MGNVHGVSILLDSAYCYNLLEKKPEQRWELLLFLEKQHSSGNLTMQNIISEAVKNKYIEYSYLVIETLLKVQTEFVTA